MPLNLDEKLVIGVSSRALFDLETENRIFEDKGLEAYSQYQIEHEKDILKPGTAFPLIKALQQLNTDGRYLTEIIIMSKNSADTSLRIFNSIEHYNLDISRAALVGGVSISPYLGAFKTDLFLSANEDDVQEAINANIASGIICDHSQLPINPEEDINQIRIAFDGDAVIFSDESERIYQEQGLQAFAEHEHKNAQNPSAVGILSAQKLAIEITSDCPFRRTFHSDRGWAYQMNSYSLALKENRIFQSMSRKGNCYDNSVMENFFGILKQEMYYGTTYYSFDELKKAIERYIKYYNEKRIKEKLGWMSPIQYRLNALAA